jgi:hypothetical protein
MCGRISLEAGSPEPGGTDDDLFDMLIGRGPLGRSGRAARRLTLCRPLRQRETGRADANSPGAELHFASVSAGRSC